ncbi:hypothetical protein BCR42DRAFT_328670 [Absidia repens]|uniref:K Homology domain-containing protein n=1 Tax=Absidia repens TaxID=90262 RepID=A0A1X2IEB8_9FUNG|nr:hypothetical protein BCR42DRAFT_328670 [Absidia repens]
MAHTVLSLCYSPIKSTQQDTDDDHSILSSIKTTCDTIMSLYRSCHITFSKFSPPDTTASLSTTINSTPPAYSITVSGPHDAAMAARTKLLQQCPCKTQLELKIPMKDLPTTFTDPKCHTAIFESIQLDTYAHISLVLPSTAHQQTSYFESENVATLCITGLPRHTELARVRLLVSLDESAKLHSGVLLIPRKLHYLICGRKRATLNPIIEETLINIYFPSPLLDLDTTTTEDNVKNEGDHATIDDKPPIYITGNATNVSRVQDMLTKLANQKAKSMYHKDSNLDARKLDWMQVHRRDDICQIMHDNGSFIDFPPHGSKSSAVTVYAENRVNAERTLRSINFLACQIYEACFYFHNRDDMYADATFFNSISNLVGLTTTLSQVSGAEVAYLSDPGCIQVFGTENNIRNVYQHLHETTFSKIYHQNTVFNVELSNDQREFISGKKNGKINKIMKTSGAKIKFLPFGEYNFILEVESSSFVKALDGLTLLQEELPAEISFYVPESYHKRIIGVGGKNIQRIMKKYGVYVKFSNAEEFASLGGYYGNEDNVVARTPMKNKTNLDNLRQAVTPKDKDFVVQLFSIPFRRHRALLDDYHIYLQEVASKTSSKIIWPNHELASDILTLVGPQCDLESMTQMLCHMVSDTYSFRVPMSTKLISVLSSPNFEDQVIRPLQHEMNISVNVMQVLENGAKMKINDAIDGGNGGQQQAIATLYSSMDPGDLSETSCTIPLTMNKAHLDCLPTALDILIRYLRKNQVPLYKDPINDATDNRTLSSRDHLTTDYGNYPFKSKLLSSIMTTGI